MVLNTKKTKIIPFNFSRKFDFVPEFMLESEKLEVVYLTKLLVLCVQVTASGRKIQNTL